MTVWRRIKRYARMARTVATDRRLPRWLRWGIVACVAVPLPGPLDELLAVALLGIVAWRFPDVWLDAKQGAGRRPPENDAPQSREAANLGAHRRDTPGIGETGKATQ